MAPHFVVLATALDMLDIISSAVLFCSTRMQDMLEVTHDLLYIMRTFEGRNFSPANRTIPRVVFQLINSSSVLLFLFNVFD